MTAPRPPRPSRAFALRPALLLLLASLTLVASVLVPPGPVAPARAINAAYPPLTGAIHGPTVVGLGLQASYRLTATGGPAISPTNGSQVGILSFSTNVVGSNTTDVQLLPTAGVLANGSANLTLVAANITQTLTLSVIVTSGLHGDNVTTNLTYNVQVIQPYSVSAQIQVASAEGTLPFLLTVLLDGAPVGTVRVPTLASRATYQVNFNYVNPGLSAGWHTFSLSLANQHGLVTFSGGATQFTQSFYIAETPPNDTFYYVLGVLFFVGIGFLWLTGSGGRRRGRRRS